MANLKIREKYLFLIFQNYLGNYYRKFKSVGKVKKLFQI